MHKLSGVYAAALTPLKDDLSFDPEGMLALLHFLAGRGCHGALLLGTTGEGPSFSVRERSQILETAVRVRIAHPDFRLMAGVGTPSLDETTTLTKQAFDLGYDAVVVLPPYYFRKASDQGIFEFYHSVLSNAVPQDGTFLGYHIPGVSGVALSLELLARLRDAHPRKFAGIKDSSGDQGHAYTLGEQFGEEMFVLNGSDNLFSDALAAGAGGCITALANLVSPDLRAVWDAHQAGKPATASQAALTAARKVTDTFPPAAVLLKYLISEFHDFPHWMVKPPLMRMSPETSSRARLAWQARGKMV